MTIQELKPMEYAKHGVTYCSIAVTDEANRLLDFGCCIYAEERAQSGEITRYIVYPDDKGGLPLPEAYKEDLYDTAAYKKIVGLDDVWNPDIFIVDGEIIYGAHRLDDCIPF